MKTLIKLNEADLRQTLEEAIEAGKQGERARIVAELNLDEVIRNYLDVYWLERVVEIVETDL